MSGCVQGVVDCRRSTRSEADGSTELRPTEARSEAGSKFPDCCRIGPPRFDYRVKAPDEHRPLKIDDHANPRR